MADVFGIEGGGQQPAPKPRPKGEEPKPSTGEGPKGPYMQYDNESGAMMIDLPPRFAKYKRELQEDLMDEFYGAAAGAKQDHQSINEWIAEWMRRKEREDPSLVQRDVE